MVRSKSVERSPPPCVRVLHKKLMLYYWFCGSDLGANVFFSWLGIQRQWFSFKNMFHINSKTTGDHIFVAFLLFTHNKLSIVHKNVFFYRFFFINSNNLKWQKSILLFYGIVYYAFLNKSNNCLPFYIFSAIFYCLHCHMTITLGILYLFSIFWCFKEKVWN